MILEVSFHEIPCMMGLNHGEHFVEASWYVVEFGGHQSHVSSHPSFEKVPIGQGEHFSNGHVESVKEQYSLRPV